MQDWKGNLVFDDSGGYKASFELGVTEIGRMAHASLFAFDSSRTLKPQSVAEQPKADFRVLA